MKPYERIRAVLERREVDRLPIDLWYVPEILDDLRAYTGVDDEMAVCAALGLDKIWSVSPGYTLVELPVPAGADEISAWGVPGRKVTSGKASYNEICANPLADFDSIDQLDSYPWPDPDLFDYAASSRAADEARSWGLATSGPWISHFEIYCQMRGLENSLMDTLADEDFLDAALTRIDAIQTEMLRRHLATVADRLELVFISDDMGTQTGPLMRQETWETHFKPRVARWCELIHSYGVKVMYHSDGACSSIIPGLIEAGVDVLNPIQHVCPGMDLESLADRFGDDLVFYGGVENQRILPFGTPQEVVAETKHCLETLGRGRQGYIACSCHNVQAGTPLENILAMIQTVQDS